MTSLSMYRHHYIHFDAMTYLWRYDIFFYVKTYFLMLWHTFWFTMYLYVITYLFLCHDVYILFNVMTYFLTLWRIFHTFWRYDVPSILIDVMTYFLTLWRTFHTFWRHDVLLDIVTKPCIMLWHICLHYDILFWLYDVFFMIYYDRLWHTLWCH